MKRKLSRKLRSRRRNQPSSLSFGQLEPRQLLAGDVAPALNLVVNGDFTVATNGVLGMYDDADVDGWNVANSEGGQKINLMPVIAQGHGNVLDLDSTGEIFDSIFQDIDTATGIEYLLTFDLRERPNSDTALEEATNDVDVLWDGDVIGTFRGNNQWQNIALTVDGGVTDLTRLGFREVVDGSVGSDGRGPLIDNVQLFNVTNMSLTNGSFEIVPSESLPGEPLAYEAGEFAEWSALGAEGFRNIQLTSGSVTEGSPLPATDGAYGLNLDASANNVDRLFRTVSTTAGSDYYVTFDMRTLSDSLTAENELRVRWNDSWATTIRGSVEWQSYGMQVSATSDATTMVFREPGGHIGDGQGPYIDNVQMFMIDQTTTDLTVDLNGSAAGIDFDASFTEDAGVTPIVGDEMTVTSENGNDLTGASVQISNLLDGEVESLAVNVGVTSITATYLSATGVLTLSGDASATDYQTVLRTLTYNNTSQDPTTTDRSISVMLQQDAGRSTPAVTTLSITPVNDPPTVDSVSDGTIAVGETFSQQVTASDPDNKDLTYDVTYTGSAIGQGDNQPRVTTDGLVTWTPSRSGTIAVTVTVGDPGGGKASTTFDITANIVGDVPGDFAPFSGNRQLSNVTPALRDKVYSAAPAMTIDVNKTYTATITTADGDMVFDLFADKAPLAVNNLVNLANDGYYDGLTFHRVIADFVAQGGDPTDSGSGGPGYSFADEFDASLTFNGSGVLAMANSGPATNGSQFFIAFAAQTHLNNLHTIFGQLTSGTDVLNAITERIPGSSLPSEIMYSVTITESP